MPVLNVREIGQIGVVSDIAPWDLPPSALTDGMNFRATSGKIQTTGGLKNAQYAWFPDRNGEIAPPSSQDQLGHLSQQTDLEGNSSWVVYGEKSVRQWDGSQVRSLLDNVGDADDASMTDTVEKVFDPPLRDPARWSSCKVGAQTFMNHPDSFPMSWLDLNNADNFVCEWLPWSPEKGTWEEAGCSTFAIRSHKNFLWALGMVEGGETYPDRVRWSHPMESNGYPYTWEPPNDVDASSIAGYVDLGRGGAVVGAESLRDSFVIYSAEAISVMDFTGDALGWRRRVISSSAGLISKEAVVEVNGIHYFMSRDDILMFDGNQVTSLLHNKLRTRLAQTLNTDSASSCWAAHNKNFNEVWFAIPESGDDYPSTAFVYNYRDGTWAIRDLERQIRFGEFGDATTSFDYRTWENLSSDSSGSGAVGKPELISWDSGRASWHISGSQPFDGVMYGVEDASVHNIDPQVPDTSPSSFISRTDLPIGGHEANTTITRVYPLIEGTSEVEVRFGSQQHAGGPVRWAGNWMRFKPGVDRKLDIRTTGELHAYEIRTVDDGFFNLTGMDVEFSLAGGR